MSAFAVLALLFVAGAASPAGGRAGGAASSAFGVRIVLPGQAGVTVGEVSAPPRGAFTTSSFRYPADGSVVTSGSISASTSAASGSAPSATAAADVSSLSLFDGDIVAETVSARARASAGQTTAQGGVGGSGFVGLTVLGEPVAAPAANQRVALADWGYVLLLEQGSVPTPRYSGFVTALDVHLTRDHGGLPAGSEILVGRAEASAQVAAPAPPPKAPPPRRPGDGARRPAADPARLPHDPEDHPASRPERLPVPDLGPRRVLGHVRREAHADLAPR